ncbi:MAG: triose-phosphate isomerase [Patescibacteria group bacterium]
MSKLILVANWKNYPNSLPEAKALLKELSKKKALFSKTTLFIAPPAPYMELVANSFAKLASQDLFPTEKGAHTGTVSVEMLKSFGTKVAILGHSERRALGESSRDVAVKVKTALKAGITPLVCVGELVKDAEGEHFEFLREEIKASLTGVSKKDVEKIMLAYEPVWAIGKSAKDVINPGELSQTTLFMRKVLSDLFGRSAAEKVSILYGGSVEPKNVSDLMTGGVRGMLVGHASLNAKSFVGIVEAIFENK